LDTLDFRALGYSPESARDLTHLKELQWVTPATKAASKQKVARR